MGAPSAKPCDHDVLQIVGTLFVSPGPPVRTSLSSLIIVESSPLEIVHNYIYILVLVPTTYHISPVVHLPLCSLLSLRPDLRAGECDDEGFYG